MTSKGVFANALEALRPIAIWNIKKQVNKTSFSTRNLIKDFEELDKTSREFINKNGFAREVTLVKVDYDETHPKECGRV